MDTDEVGYLEESEESMSFSDTEPMEQYSSTNGGYFNSLLDPDGDDVPERPVVDEDIYDLIIQSLEVQIKWIKYLKQKR